MEAKQQTNIKSMLLCVLKKVREHASFLVIVSGGLCFLLSNVILKEIFNSVDYGIYSMIVTYISVIHIYGLLGFENVFMRFSHQISNNIINVSPIQLKYIVVISAITTFISFFGFKAYFHDQISFSYTLLFFASFCSIISMFLFNLFRLNNDFTLSQLLTNLWKVSLIVISATFFVFKRNDLEHFLNVFLLVFVSIVVLLGLLLFNKISFKFTNKTSSKDIFSSFFYFFLTIVIYTILLFGDRFIIENKLGIESFGDYFYLTNIVLSPFTILQNYVGFKQLTRFKKHFNAKIFVSFNRKIAFFSIFLSILVALFVFVLDFFKFLNFDFSNYKFSITLLLILGIVRLYSSAMISAYGAQTNVTTLRITNLILICSTVLISLAIIYFCSSLNQIIIGFIVAWMMINITLRYFLMRQLNQQTTIDI